MVMRDHNKLFLFKPEDTPGVAVVPTESDVIATEGLSWDADFDMIETNLHRGGLDKSAPIVGGQKAKITFKIYLKGSGTAGTAPEFGSILKSCGLTETVFAAAVPVAAEACADGGTTTTAILGASASATAQAYRGLPVVFSGDVTGWTTITDHAADKTVTLAQTMGGAIDSASDWQIPACVRYQPGGTRVTGTAYIYEDGQRTIIKGCVGDITDETWTAGKLAELSITLTGTLVEDGTTDPGMPDADVVAAALDPTTPRPWIGGRCHMDRRAIDVSKLMIKTGNSVVTPPNPNSDTGYDAGFIDARAITGSVDPSRVSVATQDSFPLLRAASRMPLLAHIDGAAGQRVTVTLPSIQWTGLRNTARDGLSVRETPFAAPDVNAGFQLVFW